jgi:hypothetical protein
LIDEDWKRFQPSMMIGPKSWTVKTARLNGASAGQSARSARPLRLAATSYALFRQVVVQHLCGDEFGRAPRNFHTAAEPSQDWSAAKRLRVSWELPA